MTNYALTQKVLIAKALRTSFCATQSDLLKGFIVGDKSIVKAVKEMQEQHTLFKTLVNEIKEKDVALYEKEILGV